MKINTEKTELMFQKYHQFDNDKVKITLKNDVVYIGFLLGSYHNEDDLVIAWDFLEEKYVEEGKEINVFISEQDFRIEQKDILEVYFYEDQSIIKF